MRREAVRAELKIQSHLDRFGLGLLFRRGGLRFLAFLLKAAEFGGVFLELIAEAALL